MQHSQNSEIAITAGFLVEGLRDNDYDKVLETWGQGCLELIYDLTWYAELIVGMHDICAAEVEDNYSGVFLYEVVSSFGKWYGEYILRFEGSPSVLESQQCLYEALVGFFSKEMAAGTEDELGLMLRNNVYTIGEHTWQI